MSCAADRLFQYIVDRASCEDVATRISLYEDAAAVLSTEAHAPVLLDLASRLKAVQRRSNHLQLELMMRLNRPDAVERANDRINALNPGPEDV